MTTEEFSNEFDVLVDSYRRFKSFDKKEELDSLEFNEYEKSVFLTHAQEDLILSYYTGKNQSGEGFEKTEEIKRYLNALTKTAVVTTAESGSSYHGLSTNSVFYKLPRVSQADTTCDVWFTTVESVKTSTDKIIPVIPMTQDEYHRITKNPFRGANRNRVLRFDYNNDIVELIPNRYIIAEYQIRYVSKPQPIILAPLADANIYGKNTVTECPLNQVIHKDILELAVRLALQSKGYNFNKEDK